MIATCHRPKMPAILVAIGLTLAVAKCALGCAWLPGDATSDEELKYRATLLRCVDKATTLAESKACRKQADAVWLVDGGAK